MEMVGNFNFILKLRNVTDINVYTHSLTAASQVQLLCVDATLGILFLLKMCDGVYILYIDSIFPPYVTFTPQIHFLFKLT